MGTASAEEPVACPVRQGQAVGDPHEDLQVGHSAFTGTDPADLSLCHRAAGREERLAAPVSARQHEQGADVAVVEHGQDGRLVPEVVW